MKKFLVGGAVRDKLLGLEPKDLDYVVVGETPENMIKLGFTQVGADFPVFLHPETKDEYALARTEKKEGSGYNGFSCEFGENVTLEEDLGRRDLTINSMALDAAGVCVDPYNGRKDLKNKVLKHTTSAFREDPVRVLRICRFASRYNDFSISENTLSLMQEMVIAGELNHLTKERVWKELEKTLGEMQPSKFFDNLKAVGALEILFPEIHELIGVPQRADYHAEGDCYIHTMMVLDEAANLSLKEKLSKNDTVEVVAAALWHDVGKAKTAHDLLYHDDGTEKGFHHGHDDIDIVNPILNEIKIRLKMPNNVFKIVSDVALMHQKSHGLSKMSAKGIVKMFNNHNFKQKGGVNYLDKVLLACHADSLGRRLLIDGKVCHPPKNYEQRVSLVNLFKAYSSVNVKTDFIDKHILKNNEKPSNDLIISANHRLRLNAIKPLIKSKSTKGLNL